MCKYFYIGSNFFGKPSGNNIFDIFKKHSVAFAGSKKPEYYEGKIKVGDRVAITDGFKVIAIGVANTSSHIITESNYDFTEEEKSRIEFEEWVIIVGLDLYELEEEDTFQYKGALKAIDIIEKNNDIKNNIDRLLGKYMLNKNYLELLKQNKNLIFTGAPGTGKTYLAKQIASKLCLGEYYEVLMNDEKLSEDEKSRLKKDFEHQCGFVQFHPSYDYTDFVEGLRPVNNGESNIGFERRDGVFKDFCKRALENYFDSRKDTKLLSLETIVKKYLIDFIENVKNILDISSSEDFIKEIKNIIDKSNNQDLKDKTEIRLTTYKDNIDNEKEVTNFYPILGISELVAAPIISINIDDEDKLVFKVGTKYNYTVKKFKLDTWVKWFIEFRENNVSQYTENKLLNTINSAKSELNANKIKWDITYIYGFLRAFYDEYNERIIEEETKNINLEKVELKNFVFIIDEINRGEISKIFGELFFSVDPGYRGEKGKVNTQYQNLIKDDIFENGFYIPENVYIIGTMNDIDRSVESMDFAMRRRFAWLEVEVENTQSMLDNMFENVPSREDILITLKQRMDRLNKKIVSTEGLSKHYEIGSSYFLKLEHYYDKSKNNIEEAFESLWKYHLKGLLAEYLRGIPDEDGILKELKKAYDNKIQENNNTEEEQKTSTDTINNNPQN